VNGWLGLEGSRVLVAGAGSIGAAIATGFAEAGAVVVAMDANVDRLGRLASSTTLAGTLTADLATAVACREAFADAVRVLGGLDVLVHCIGVNRRVAIDEYSEDDWARMLAVNLSSAFWLLQEALPAMRAQRHGRIVLFSSVAARLAHREHGPYAATKAALDQLARVAAHESAADGVTVNTVAPGYTETNLTTDYLKGEATRRALISLVPAGRLGNVEDVVGPTLFLASERARFVTGHVLVVDGGRTLV
jgi:NAD(P)-dependent dehydrogenase (short-subunit alcohol dehydrogenase family)